MNLVRPTDLAILESQLGALARFEYLGHAADAWLDRVDIILPPEAVSTDRWARDERKIKGTGELEYRFDPDLTPYVTGIHDAADMRGVKVVAVQGPGRGVKTLAAENIALRRWQHGPYGDMLWYMQSGDDVDDYMEERGEWNLDNHPKVSEKVDRAYKRNARNRKRIGTSMARWLPATKQTTRGKGAPFIVGDEIDAWPVKIMTALPGILRNRQREFGSAALLYLASHPDAGPQFGIANIISQGVQHLWWWTCLDCGKASSPAQEATIRANWNLPKLMEEVKGVEKTDALEYVKQNVRVVCPHCGSEYDNDRRKILSTMTGAWLQPGQTLVGPKTVEGPSVVGDIMGFIIHAFQAPFADLGEAAAEWLSAYLDFQNTGNENGLKEVTVKTLGEVFQGASAETKIDDWEVVAKRMKSGDTYPMKSVPDGVDFLTAFVDIQARGFEVRVIGWSGTTKESWFIDGRLLSQHLGGPRNGDKLDPFHILADWSVLEEAVFQQSYPLLSDLDWHLPIARVVIDVQGGDKTTDNARQWASAMLHRGVDPIPEWRVVLSRGSKYKDGETWGKAKQVLKDDRGRDLPGAIWERDPRVHIIKKIVRRRQNILLPGEPGFMAAPVDMPESYFREMVSEKFIADEWVKSGDNETWDAYVACEMARATIQPDRVDWTLSDMKRPIWARPFRPGIDAGIDRKPRSAVSPYARMLRVNRQG